jgi:molybdopterin converting factor subunit 1
MRILFFAQLRDAAGQSEMTLRVDGPLDAAGLWRRLVAERPGLARYRRCVRLARNREYAGSGVRFHDADEVALIPPVSGG